MFLLFYEKYSIKSAMTEREAINALQTVIEPFQFFRFFGWGAIKKENKPFDGEIIDNTFNPKNSRIFLTINKNHRFGLFSIDQI